MSITKEYTGVWLFVYFVSLVGAVALSSFLIEVGYEQLAKVLFLWLPFIAIVVVKFFESPILRKYFESGDHRQWTLRKGAPRIVNLLFRTIPIMAFLMVGYALAHLSKHGSI